MAPDVAAVVECAAFLDAQTAGGILLLCGSVPGWATPALEPLRASLRRWSEKGILIVDTYGPPLFDLTQLPLALLKINADELQSLGLSKPEALPRMIQHAIITDGPRPVRVRDRDGTVSEFTPPIVREISATGSGDVLLAGVVEAMFVRKLPLASAVAWAMPYASANAAHAGIAEFPWPSAGS